MVFQIKLTYTDQNNFSGEYLVMNVKIINNFSTNVFLMYMCLYLASIGIFFCGTQLRYVAKIMVWVGNPGSPLQTPQTRNLERGYLGTKYDLLPNNVLVIVNALDHLLCLYEFVLSFQPRRCS